MTKLIARILLTLIFSFQLQLMNPSDIALAGEPSPSVVLERLFTSSEPQRDWFADAFLRQIPLPQIDRILTNIQQTLGSYQQVQTEGKDYRVVFEKGSVPTQITLDAEGKISLLLFKPPVTQSISLSEAVAAFEKLPGEVSFLVMQGNSTLAELNADQPLAVGSAFKLAVLALLQEQIAASQRSWRDVVELQPQWKSLPSGILQTWPDNSPLTLQTLASLMISLSDNTATDALIYILGREQVENFSTRNRPFLTTREAFALKNPQNQELLSRYQRSDIAKRRQILQQLKEAPLPNVELFNGEPLALDVEWFFSMRELCSLMAKVAPLPLMSINPGLANPEDWQRVAFKGGSEPGVYNLTTWLEAKDGKTYCVAATQNSNQPINEASFVTLYSATLEGLKSKLPLD
ncbi:serine hydrolase [Lyngbya aestuarii]|uniref:serine hydrolase n=1 Tax=Lyngbya aestuarii TaxID=118322 RepID=UPI00403DCAE6